VPVDGILKVRVKNIIRTSDEASGFNVRKCFSDNSQSSENDNASCVIYDV
jgi:hypothetical protein